MEPVGIGVGLGGGGGLTGVAGIDVGLLVGATMELVGIDAGLVGIGVE
jgi:hypothetical protein